MVNCLTKRTTTIPSMFSLDRDRTRPWLDGVSLLKSISSNGLIDVDGLNSSRTFVPLLHVDGSSSIRSRSTYWNTIRQQNEYGRYLTTGSCWQWLSCWADDDDCSISSIDSDCVVCVVVAAVLLTTTGIRSTIPGLNKQSHVFVDRTQRPHNRPDRIMFSKQCRIFDSSCL
jgi:hypothetical protein